MAFTINKVVPSITKSKVGMFIVVCSEADLSQLIKGGKRGDRGGLDEDQRVVVKGCLLLLAVSYQEYHIFLKVMSL